MLGFQLGIRIYLRDISLVHCAGLRCIYKRHSSSSDRKRIVSNRRSRLSASERRQPSITRFARLIPLPRAARCKSPLDCLLIAYEVWRLKPFPLRSKVIRLQLAMPLLSPQGKNDRLRYRSAEWTVGTPWPERFQLRWHLRLRLGNVSKLPSLSACT